jgi:hypothetical protein
MRGQAGFFDVDESLKELSAKGDELERLNAIVNFEMFRADLERAVPRSDRSKGGRLGRADGISDRHSPDDSLVAIETAPIARLWKD